MQKVITIADFFSNATQQPKNFRYVSKDLRVLYLKEAIKQIDITKLGIQSDFSNFMKQSEYIFRFFNEINSEYVDFEELLNHDTYLAYSDHIDILITIYKNYEKILLQNGLTDVIFDPLHLKLNTGYFQRFDGVFIYLEGYLSRYEAKIIHQLSQNIDLTIDFSLNIYNQKNIFLFSENLQKDLLLDHQYTINMTKQKIQQQQAIKSVCEDITISAVGSKIEQIGFIKYQITKMVQKGIDPSRIVLITPDESYTQLLELFDQEHYFNYAMGRSVVQTQVLKVLKLITKLAVDKDPKDIFKLEFFSLSKENIETIFLNRWNQILDHNIYDEVFDFVFSIPLNIELAKEIEQIKISLKLVLFHKYMNHFEPLRLKDFMKIFITKLSQITMDDTSGGKITVMGILETRNIQYDGVIVCDFNDDKIPKISIKDKFISTNLKRKVNLPTNEDRQNLQRYYYKRLFDQSKMIAISYIDDQVSVMSRFLTSLFPDYKKYLVSQNYSSIVFLKKTLNHYDQPIVLNIDLSNQKWSATALKTYLTCKRKYYLSYILNLKDHNTSLQPQSFDVGNIIHNVLEEGVKKQLFHMNFISNRLSEFAKTNPYLVLELELWKKRLEHFMEFEKIRFENGVVIDQVELPFELKVDGITIKGKIDRIDKNSDGSFTILDYKTSASLKVDTLKTYEDSKDFQLEFYYLALQQNNISSVAYYDLYHSKILQEEVLEQKLKLLKDHFKALYTTQVDFCKTPNRSDCSFCSFQTICNRR
ncbi:MAG: PD-(D/E)XK nuclease family protein [Campylobacterales bacterium]|nr:PD-(D/E)XK nuclease family protein [Campylobacterales bacterium]